MHTVFHISQLQQALLPGTPVATELPLCTDDLAIPLDVLQTRWRKQRGSVVEQIQVKWSDATNPGVTWEDKEALRARFPRAAAWGQAVSQGGGMSATLTLRAQQAAAHLAPTLPGDLLASGSPTQDCVGRTRPSEAGSHHYFYQLARGGKSSSGSTAKWLGGYLPQFPFASSAS